MLNGFYTLFQIFQIVFILLFRIKLSCVLTMDFILTKYESDEESTMADENMNTISRCNIAKRRKQQCDAGAYLLFHCNSHKVTLYKTDDTHTHHNLEDVTIRMSEEFKSEIKSLFDLNIPPKKNV